LLVAVNFVPPAAPATADAAPQSGRAALVLLAAVGLAMAMAWGPAAGRARVLMLLLALLVVPFAGCGGGGGGGGTPAGAQAVGLQYEFRQATFSAGSSTETIQSVFDGAIKRFEP
jgi:hypothetical protein